MKTPNVSKIRVDDLALFGGPPAFARPVTVGEPNIPDVEGVLTGLRDVLRSRRLSNNGPFVLRLEEEIRKIAGTDHCVATCNGTAALEVTARALGLQGEVIVPSFTYIATPHALAWQGLQPVFVDVDSITHTIDATKVEAAITPRTTAICGVHLWGNVCDIDPLVSIAERRKLTLWFDAAQAFACEANGRKVGNFGHAEIFSFHATKFINSFEGGAIVTNDGELARTMRAMRNFGYEEHGEIAYLGINGKMSEASAVMGLKSLEHLAEILATNRRNYRRYAEQLASCPGIRLVGPDVPETSNCQYIVIEVDEHEAGLSRDLLMTVLEADGILARRYFYPCCHRAEPYREMYRKQNTTLPVTERLSEEVLALPTGQYVNTGQVDWICALIHFAVRSSAEIHRKLKGRDTAQPGMMSQDPVHGSHNEPRQAKST